MQRILTCLLNLDTCPRWQLSVAAEHANWLGMYEEESILRDAYTRRLMANC